MEFILIVGNKEEKLAYQEILDLPKKASVENVAIMVIPPSKSEYELPTILTDSINYYGSRAVNNFLYSLK